MRRELPQASSLPAPVPASTLASRLSGPRTRVPWPHSDHVTLQFRFAK